MVYICTNYIVILFLGIILLVVLLTLSYMYIEKKVHTNGYMCYIVLIVLYVIIVIIIIRVKSCDEKGGKWLVIGR